MSVSVRTTPGSLVRRSAMTSASCSWRRTRTIATRSISPVTEYTSVTPSRSAICCANSGMRSTDAVMSTTAVTTLLLLSSRRNCWAKPSARNLSRRQLTAGRPARRTQHPPVVQRSQPLPPGGGQIEQPAEPPGAEGGGGPRPVQLDQPNPGAGQPPQDALGLLRRRRGQRTRSPLDRLRGRDQRGEERADGCTGRGDARGDQATVSHDRQLPPAGAVGR